MLRLMVDRRWAADERGDGVGDASQLTDGAAELMAAMHRPNWVAEEPDLHLLPHLERACESLPLQILGTRTLTMVRTTCSSAGPETKPGSVLSGRRSSLYSAGSPNLRATSDSGGRTPTDRD